MKKKRFRELDALRGLAAIMIVLFHYTMSRNEAHFGFKLGVTGVDLFFMISGFVILLSLEHTKKSGQFIINRISRLYPTYWTCVTITFTLLVLHGIYKMDFNRVSIVQYLGNMTMFQFYLKIPNLDGPYWTMIVEMLFYIFMVLLFHFKWLIHLDKIGVLLTILIVAMVYFPVHDVWVSRVLYGVPLLQFWPLFFSGILFYKIMANRTHLTKYYGMIILCLVSQIALFDFFGQSRFFINFWEYAIMLILYFSIFSLFVHGKLKFIIRKPLLFLGKISFALYLIHQKLSMWFVIPILNNRLNMNFWMASAIALICSIGLATCITYLIEVRYSKKMKNKLYVIFNKQH